MGWLLFQSNGPSVFPARLSAFQFPDFSQPDLFLTCLPSIISAVN